MTLEQILKLLDSASVAFAAAIKLAREARDGLPDDDQTALDERLVALGARNDAEFARVDADLKAAEAL